MKQPATLFFSASEWVPNHPFLPVLVYRAVLAADVDDRAHAFEQLFRAAGWLGLWRNGVFSYQHYHVGAHEVLGIAEGRAELLIGGPDGEALEVRAGDCLVLPAGTGHKRNGASDDFLVIGGYPPGQYADIATAGATEGELRIIASLPVPETDPLYGSTGPLVALWRSGDT
ncbi:cupin domain-containing protein [Shinella curvata]|uniref:Cupin domain-containing protein n=1 Tax=Shinella curvata TaxID=1817964 RepID=A0ABT8XBV3_9HYPH|nr:cupin domain-containing protein [Shinella curvata]MCJ8054687.1 cupin domain-containing protein [Shinella curvata]MDO6120918.1 cupin domain-containing protein [Shinella curvata]